MRRTPLPLAALVLIGLLAGCGGDPGTIGSPGTPAPTGSSGSTPATSATPAGADGIGTAPATPPAPAPAKTVKATAKPVVPALTCGKLLSAKLGSPTVRFNDYPDPIPLSEGRWAGEDGVTVESQPACGIGDLDGDSRPDAIRAIVMNTGGTGRFISLVVWRNVAGNPVYLTVTDLGDRTPVETIAISGGKATVVYLTRSADAPMAMLDIRRTAIFRLSGGALAEVGHTDVAYSG